MSHTADRHVLRRYLLGETSDSENDAIERGYLVAGPALEAVAEAEEDLIDDHLAGRLDPAARRRFEEHYLASPVHRRRVALSRALRQRPRPLRIVRSTPLLSLAAALVVAVLGAFLWQRGAPVPVARVDVVLPAILLRDGGGSPTARLGASATTVVLRFEEGTVPADPPLEAVVRTPDGAEVWRGAAVPAEDPGRRTPPIVAIAEVPARLLPAGDYVVSLLHLDAAGAQELQRSPLRVVAE